MCSHATEKPREATVPHSERILYSRADAAQLLSISPRAIDYLVGTKALNARRLGRRLLIPATELRRFARADYLGTLRPV